MPEYSIPEPAHSILAHVAPILLEFCGPEEIAIGGGTALAARWRHRRSTDIDLFMSSEAFARPRGGWAPLMENTPVLRSQGGQGWFNGILREGEFSISTTPRLLPPDAGHRPDLVRGWAIRLEDPAEILAKKMRLRMYGNGEFYSRDFYDVCTAAEQDPTALRAAFGVLSKVESLEISREIRALRPRLSERDRPLEEVHRPEWINNLTLRTADLFSYGVPRHEPDPKHGPRKSFEPDF